MLKCLSTRKQVVCTPKIALLRTKLRSVVQSLDESLNFPLDKLKTRIALADQLKPIFLAPNWSLLLNQIIETIHNGIRI